MLFKLHREDLLLYRQFNSYMNDMRAEQKGSYTESDVVSFFTSKFKDSDETEREKLKVHFLDIYRCEVVHPWNTDDEELLAEAGFSEARRGVQRENTDVNVIFTRRT